MRAIKKGAVDQSVYVEILDSTSTNGARKTGLVFNTAGLTAYYVRNGGSANAITLATLAAANSAHGDGGFKEVDAANMPGVYRLDLPDAAVASGADTVVVTVRGATGAAQVSLEIQLVDNVVKDAVDRLPAALVSGRIDSHVGSIADAVLTAAKFAAGAFDAVWSVTARLLTAGTNIVLAKGTGITGFNDIAAGAAMTLTSGERGAVADAVWDEAISGHLTAGSTGNALNAAGSAGDPWSTPLPGAYGGGTAGNIVGNTLDAAVSTRASQTSVDDVPTNAELATALAAADDAVLAAVATVDTVVDAIKVSTDNLPSDPADQSLIIAATDAVRADVAAVKTQTDAIEVDTQNIQSRLPAALTVAGNMKSDMLAVNGDATAAANQAKTTRAIGRGTVGSGSTTTSIVTSAFSPAGAAADQFKGRIITFDADTTTAALRGQSTDITASTNVATPTLTVTALTTAPASGDTFSVT